jgi:hypothetical protein
MFCQQFGKIHDKNSADASDGVWQVNDVHVKVITDS